MILSYWAHRYGNLDTLNYKICLLVKILSIFLFSLCKIFFQFHFSPQWWRWHHLKMILSYWARRYGNLDTLNSKIRPLQQILEIDGGKSEEEQQQQEEDPIIIEEDLKTIIYFQGLCQILFIGRDFFQGLCQFLLLAETVSFFQDYFFIGRDYFLFFRVSANYFFCEETVSANFIFLEETVCQFPLPYF